MDRSLIVARAKAAILESEEIDLATFADDVFLKAELADRFMEYKEASGYSSSIPNEKFKIDSKIPKKRIGLPSNVIHLDGLFDIVIKGGEERIIRGYDSENGMNYYKLFYIEER